MERSIELVIGTASGNLQVGATSGSESLVPYAGWLLAVALVIWISKQYLGRLLQELGGRSAPFFIRAFRRRLFTRRGLRRYRSSLIGSYGEHALGFRRDGTVNVDQVYVSLQYLNDGRREDIAGKVIRSERSVILGEPGAGKSLLMKHLLTKWAQLQWLAVPVPVLVELHRCVDGSVSFIDLISAELDRHGIRAREGALEAALDDGELFVLFDGLDEVPRDNLAEVVTMIKDFVVRWDECRFATTCRAAVYAGQLSPQFSKTLGIIDFDDAGIRKLLAKWPGLNPTEQDRFFSSLTDSPQLMRLAGSPLLLTMMVYLQTEVFAKAGRTLPTSRSAFYEIAVDHLLRRDRDLARNDALAVYEGADKRAALQCIALALHQNSPEQPDRRSIERIQLLDLVKSLAGRLNLRDQDISPLIREIVDRSQLLVNLGGHSERYSFRHLTLQEYLTASELRHDSGALLDAYRGDPDGWREVLTLWCGITSLDCTQVIEEVFSGDEHEKLLALRCVAEAANVDPHAVETVIAHFIEVLETGIPNGPVETMLGAVASDDRPRGVTVLHLLEALFLNQGPGSSGAARALAATRRHEAAATLGSLLLVNPEARDALRGMGEQAVPALQAAAANGDVCSVDDLGEIATATAANALAELIWDRSEIAFRAAWWLCALIRHSEVEDGLDGSSIRDDVEEFSWVWAPFGGTNTAAAKIIGRAAWLLNEDVSNHSPDSITIDGRVAVAIFALGESNGRSPSAARRPRRQNSDPHGLRTLAADLLGKKGISFPIGADAAVLLEYAASVHRDVIGDVVSAAVESSQLDARRKIIFDRMPWEYQYQVVSDGLLDTAMRDCLTVRQWTELRKPPRVEDWTMGPILVGVFAAALGGLGSAVYHVVGLWAKLPYLGPGLIHVGVLCASVVLVLAFLIGLVSKPEKKRTGKKSGDSGSVLRFRHLCSEFVDGTVFISVVVTAAIVCVLSSFVIVFQVLGWVSSAVAFGVLLVLVAGYAVVAKVLESRSWNPFRVYIERSTRGRRSALRDSNPWLSAELESIEEDQAPVIGVPLTS
ncbi:NACHT domain-containing protein [Kribbella sp. NPDC020789]